MSLNQLTALLWALFAGACLYHGDWAFGLGGAALAYLVEKYL